MTYAAWTVQPHSSDHSPHSSTILHNLSLARSLTKPIPGPHEVLVRIRAASLNFRDLLVIANSPTYPVRTTPGVVPCSDGAGEIEALGPSTSNEWKIGDRVLLKPNQSWITGGVTSFDIPLALGGGDMHGTLQQYRLVGAEWLVRIPEHLSFEEAATLPTAGSTAVNCLFHNGPDSMHGPTGLDLTGTTVLAQGTGGVSCFIVQLAAKAGAKVIATSSDDGKLEMAKSIGATGLVNYKTTPDWASEILDLTNGKGVDIVVEVGGAGTIEQSLKATRRGGTVVVVGILTESQKLDLVPTILFGAKTVRGSLGSSKQMIRELVDMVEQYRIRPVVGQVFSWEEAPSAFECMMKQGTVGKIVVTV